MGKMLCPSHPMTLGVLERLGVGLPLSVVGLAVEFTAKVYFFPKDLQPATISQKS